MTKDTNKENALKIIRYIQSNTGGKELNHLLLAIGNAEIEQDIEDLYMEVLNRYDLTKTVQENLESNEALCQYLLDLFQLTTNN